MPTKVVGRERWILVSVEDSVLRDRPLNGAKLRFMVSPKMSLLSEFRTEDEVVGAAADSGFEVSYCSSCRDAMPKWEWEALEKKVLSRLRADLGVNVRSFDVCISPVARMTKYQLEEVR